MSNIQRLNAVYDPSELKEVKNFNIQSENSPIQGDTSVTFGDQLLNEVIKDPTINVYLDRSHKLNQPKDYEEMVKRLHYQRAAFITAEQKKKEPKIEGEE